MARWEAQVLNKLYKTDFFTQVVKEGPPTLDNLIEAYSQFSHQNIDQQQNIFQLASKAIQLEKSKDVFRVITEISSILNTKNCFLPPQYSYLDVIIFSALSRCKIWPKIYKEMKGGVSDKQFMRFEQQEIKPRSVNPQLSPILNWYAEFLKDFSNELEWKFDRTVLSQKQIKMIERRKNNRKDNKLFFQSLKEKKIIKIKEFLATENFQDLMAYVENDTFKKAIHFACESGSLEVVKLLDQYHPKWDELDGEQQTPLFYAVESQSLDVIRFLIEEKHLNIDHRECQNRTPFYLACFLGFEEIIDYLYQKGADINALSKLKRTPLSKACYLNHINVVRWLLEKQNINILQQDSKGRTALHNAAWGRAGGKEGKKRGDQLLPDSPESVKLLLKYKHPVDLIDFEGNSALQSATSSNALDSVPILIDAGAERERQNCYGETPFWMAARYGHLEMIKMLAFQYHCSITTPDSKGLTPLLTSIIYANDQIMIYLTDLLINQVDGVNFNSNNQNLQEKQSRYKLAQKENFQNEIKALIDIEQIVKTCQVYKKENSCGKFINLINSYFEKKQFDTNLFFQQDEMDLHQKMVKIISMVTSKQLTSELIKLFNFINDNQSKPEFVTILCEEFLLSNPENVSLLWDQLEQYQIKNINPNSIMKALCKGSNLNEENFMRILFDLNLAVLKQEGLIHLLIRQKRTKPLTQVLNSGIVQIDVILNERSTENLTAVELAAAYKANDIQQVLEKFLGCQAKSKVPDYEIKFVKIQSQLIESEIYQWNLSEINLNSKQKPAKLIDRIDQIPEMNLVDSQFIAVDLEYYSDFVCTLQLTTNNNSYLIDALMLRDYLMSELCIIKQVFLEPKILKIFHGCETDLKWLASNFGYHVTSLYDTSKAENIISPSKNSQGLQVLSQKYLQIKLDKKFQISDWRLRPLFESMQEYAIMDSSILFPIAEKQLKLLSQIQFEQVLAQGKEMSDKIYLKHSQERLILTLK